MVSTKIKEILFEDLSFKMYEEALQINIHSLECIWDSKNIFELLEKENVSGVVLKNEINDRIMGFVVYESMLFSVEILNLVVHPDYRREGVGSLIIDFLKEDYSDSKAIRYKLRESNLIGQIFLKNNNFVSEGVVKDYFSDSYPNCIEKENAYSFLFLKIKN